MFIFLLLLLTCCHAACLPKSRGTVVYSAGLANATGRDCPAFRPDHDDVRYVGFNQRIISLDPFFLGCALPKVATWWSSPCRGGRAYIGTSTRVHAKIVNCSELHHVLCIYGDVDVN